MGELANFAWWFWTVDIESNLSKYAQMIYYEKKLCVLGLFLSNFWPFCQDIQISQKIIQFQVNDEKWSIFSHSANSRYYKALKFCRPVLQASTTTANRRTTITVRSEHSLILLSFCRPDLTASMICWTLLYHILILNDLYVCIVPLCVTRT